MAVALLGMAFLALWAGSALLLSCLPWFQCQQPCPDAERLRPFVPRDEPDWVIDVEGWLARH